MESTPSEQPKADWEKGLSEEPKDDWERGLSVVNLDLIGSYLSPGDLYNTFQVCMHWYGSMGNSRQMWRDLCQQRNYHISPGEGQHPKDTFKINHLVTNKIKRKEFKVTNIRLEGLPLPGDVESELKFGSVSSPFHVLSKVRVGDGFLCILCPAGTLHFVLYINYYFI